MATAECKIWVMVDEDGNYVAHAEPEKLKELYEEEYQELSGTFQTRLVQITVNVPLPKPIMIEATVLDLPNDATVAVA